MNRKAANDPSPLVLGYWKADGLQSGEDKYIRDLVRTADELWQKLQELQLAGVTSAVITLRAWKDGGTE